MIELYLDCPACGQESEFVIGITQAICTSPEDVCKVLFFNPSLPDGGITNAHFIGGEG